MQILRRTLLTSFASTFALGALFTAAPITSNHPVLKQLVGVQQAEARHGADNGAGDDHGGRGRDNAAGDDHGGRRGGDRANSADDDGTPDRGHGDNPAVVVPGDDDGTPDQGPGDR